MADSAHMLVMDERQVSSVRYIPVRELLDHWDRGDPAFVGISDDDVVSFELASPSKQASKEAQRETDDEEDSRYC